ncbi:methionine synthase [Nocardioides sp. Soil797]|nr:methionine synthase [Nocardioides sp. Soil797]
MPGGDALGNEADNARSYAEAVRVVVGELPDVVHVPELPGRGAGASMTGRGLAVMSGLGADLQPAGWRLTDHSGVDHRRARSLLAQDLDAVEELTQDFAGVFKTQVAGPWTLAATVEKPRGDKVLSDHGARRELTESLAEGLRDHVADVRRRMTQASELIIQIDEPALPAVLAAQIPTASGWGKHRAVHPPEASAALELVCAAISDAGATPIVHSCAPGFPITLVRGAGARGISLDLDLLDTSSYDALADAVESGDRVLLGVVPTMNDLPTDKQVVERVLRLLDMLGLDLSPNLVITPACGLAGASTTRARQALALAAGVARSLA